MSTVYGIFDRKKNAIENSTIQAMDEALAYWDADESGIWSNSSVFLGHQMLWNTPESKLKKIPHTISPNNQTLVITIDARLDNRETLSEQLEIDLPLEEITDSDFVLAAYQKWGEDCPKHLLGDFVFVIWDAIKEQLFCARDHIGIKPFYYHLNDDLFVFSNDIRGLIAHPQISKKYNDRSIAMFLAGRFGFYDEKETFFEEIQKLPAAASLTITNDHVSESVYWDTKNIAAVHYGTYEEYVERLRELLSDAVKVRLRTVYPVASHLSGGLDSSAIAVLAARELEKRNQPLYAFNWIETPTGEYDPAYPDWGFATQLANLENIEKKNIRLTADFMAEMYDKVDITKDDISFFWNEYLVREEAEKYGVRSLLSGWGGDELISYNEYAYLSGLFCNGQFVKAIKEISILYKDKNYKYLRIIKRSLREFIYPLFYKRMDGNYKKDKYGLDHFSFARNHFSTATKGFSFPGLAYRPGVHNEQKALFKDGYLQQRIENWASSAFEKKLEYSYPLLDKRIVEFALAAPEDLFVWKEGHARYLLKSAVSSFIPKNIVWAVKNGEIEHNKVWDNLWSESLRVWMLKNEKTSKNKSSYINRPKIIKWLKMYFTNKDNGKEDSLGNYKIVPSILLSNLTNKGR